MEHFDVIIVGAGLAGIQSAYYLQRDCPEHSFVILESRQDLGGTWDLFKYPGVRSDSDMYTYGYTFNPWPGQNEIANGADIKNYIKQTAEKYNISQQIRFNHLVTGLEWKTDRWYITLENQPTVTCHFIIMCAGYYDYKNPHTPEIQGQDRYTGIIVHPQHWSNINYKDKDITIIGSGATMVTLAPELAKLAKSVTVIQRSPGYIVNSPKQPINSRYKTIWGNIKFWKYCRDNPGEAAKILSRPGYDMPSYYPWEQRVCVTVDNEFFECVDSGKIKLITSLIDSYDSTGIKLTNGQIIQSDIVITATGFNIQFVGGVDIVVDSKLINLQDTVYYRGAMFTGIPNLIAGLGYVNQVYTLRTDLISQYAVRLLKYMKKHNLRTCTPDIDGPRTNLPLQSNYFKRTVDALPKRTWKYGDNYFKEWFIFKFCNIKTGMIFK